jgi:hypothetical protein
MEAVHFVEDLATGVELALVSPHPLDRRDIRLLVGYRENGPAGVTTAGERRCSAL